MCQSVDFCALGPRCRMWADFYTTSNKKYIDYLGSSQALSTKPLSALQHPHAAPSAYHGACKNDQRAHAQIVQPAHNSHQLSSEQPDRQPLTQLTFPEHSTTHTYLQRLTLLKDLLNLTASTVLSPSRPHRRHGRRPSRRGQSRLHEERLSVVIETVHHHPGQHLDASERYSYEQEQLRSMEKECQDHFEQAHLPSRSKIVELRQPRRLFLNRRLPKAPD